MQPIVAYRELVKIFLFTLVKSITCNLSVSNITSWTNFKADSAQSSSNKYKNYLLEVYT